MTKEITIEFDVRAFRRGRPARRDEPALVQPKSVLGRMPRLSKLMALAIHLEGLRRAGEVADYAELARLGHVTRARMTQIMNLLLLAPDIQEEILFLSPLESGRAPILLRHLQPIAAVADWGKQRRLWKK